MQEIVACGIVAVASSVVREIVAKGRFGKLLGKKIDFVKEKNLKSTRQSY
jgi:hypothetical protein